MKIWDGSTNPAFHKALTLISAVGEEALKLSESEAIEHITARMVTAKVTTALARYPKECIAAAPVSTPPSSPRLARIKAEEAGSPARVLVQGFVGVAGSVDENSDVLSTWREMIGLHYVQRDPRIIRGLHESQSSHTNLEERLMINKKTFFPHVQ